MTRDSQQKSKENRTRAFSWLDVRAMVSEIKPYLLNAKVDKVYEICHNVLQIRFHHPVHKKTNFVIALPNYFFITKKEFDKPTSPSSFVMLLRKKIQNARLISIEQVDSERLIKLSFSKEENFVFYIELIKPGNVILCDEDDLIITAYRILEFSSRTISAKNKYEFPFKQDIINLNKEQFIQLLRNSNKQNIVKSLALDLNVGGFYSEQILLKLNIDKNRSANELSEKELTAIYDFFRDLIEFSGKENDKESCLISKSYLPRLHPAFQFNKKLCSKTFSSFSSMMSYVFESSAIAYPQENIRNKALDKKIDKIKRIIESQLKELEVTKTQYEQANSIGESIYQNYSFLKDILTNIRSFRKKKLSYEKIEKLLNERGYQLKIDSKNNKLIIEL